MNRLLGRRERRKVLGPNQKLRTAWNAETQEQQRRCPGQEPLTPRRSASLLGRLLWLFRPQTFTKQTNSAKQGLKRRQRLPPSRCPRDPRVRGTNMPHLVLPRQPHPMDPGDAQDGSPDLSRDGAVTMLSVTRGWL